MGRTALCVPYHQKDEAKKLGAKWDSEQKIWFVPDGIDLSPFAKWLPSNDANPNIRSQSFYIAESKRECWKCHQITRVFGFILPSGFEALWVGDKPEDDVWDVYDEPTVLSYVTWLSEKPVNAMQSISKRYRVSFSKTTGSSYLANRCEHCDALQGDFETIEEFDSSLSPASPESAKKILLRHYQQPFEASCVSYVISGLAYFEYMRKIEMAGK